MAACCAAAIYSCMDSSSDYELPDHGCTDVLTEWHTLRAYREQPNGTFPVLREAERGFQCLGGGR